MTKSKVIALLSVFGVIGGIFMVTSEDTNAAQQRRKEFHFRAHEEGGIRAHTQVIKTECIRVHTHLLRCNTETRMMIGD